MTTRTLPTIERHPAQRTEPGKRWRNVWRAVQLAEDTCFHCGAVRMVEPGDVFRAHCMTFPTADTAKEVAQSIIDFAASHGQETHQYLGPEEAP